MANAAQPTLPNPKADRCPRCLQPVPPKVERCPACFHPIQSFRLLPWLIAAAGLLALVFAVVVMYRMVRTEDAINAPPPVDESLADRQVLLPDPPPEGSKPSQPAKPEKPPPLNER